MAHRFTPIAPEYNSDDGPGDVIWKWCVDCGCMKLGDEYFVPGQEHPKGVLKAATKRPECIRTRRYPPHPLDTSKVKRA